MASPLVIVAIAGLVASVTLVLLAAVVRHLDRREPRWFVPVAALAFGAGASLLLSGSAADPMSILVPLTAAALPALLIAASRRFDLAGWYFIGVGIPSIAFSAVIPGAIAAALGALGLFVGNRTPTLVRTPPTEPDPGRAVSIATAMQRELSFGPIDLPNLVALIVGVAGGVAVALTLGALGAGGLVAAAVSVVVTVLLMTEVFYRAWPPRLERAMAAHAFLGSWETKRFVAQTGTQPPTSAAAALQWLDRYPETDESRWLRSELLAFAGRIDEAYEVLARIEASSDEERFERRSIDAYLAIVSGRPADIDALMAAAEEVGEPGSDERLRAVTAAAVNESRRRLAYGEDDWMGPLLAVQERIGPRALGIRRADTWMPRFRSLAIAFGGLFVVTALFGLMPQ